MGMKITVSVSGDDADKIRDLIRTAIRERTGKDPVIHVVQSSAKLDNLQRTAYHNSIRTPGALNE